MKKSKFSLIKNWFTFTQSERSATYALLFLVLIFASIPFVYDAFFRPKSKLAYQEIYVNQIKKQQQSSNLLAENKKDNQKINESIGFIGDLNVATWKSLVSSGLDSKTANSILNYGKAIKGFKNWQQVEKIYGMDDEKLSLIKTHFSLTIIANQKEFEQEKSISKTTVTKKIIEINNTDSAGLRAISGIGGYFAGKIIQLRKDLGGFNNLEQLKEIYGMTDSSFLKIEKQLTCDGSVNKINVNTAAAQQLAKHPYIKWAVANRVEKYIKQHQKINNIEEFKKASLIGDEQLNKLRPYLIFE